MYREWKVDQLDALSTELRDQGFVPDAITMLTDTIEMCMDVAYEMGQGEDGESD